MKKNRKKVPIIKAIRYWLLFCHKSFPVAFLHRPMLGETKKHIYRL